MTDTCGINNWTNEWICLSPPSPAPAVYFILLYAPSLSALCSSRSKPFTQGLSPKIKCPFFGGVSPFFPPHNIVHISVFITLITSLHTLHSLLRVLNPVSLPIPPGLESYQIVFIFFSTWHMTGLPSRFISELKPVGIQAGMDKLSSEPTDQQIVVWLDGVTTLTWNFRIFSHKRSCLHFKITAQWKFPEH